MTVHTFAGSPLDRAVERRRDAAWQAATRRDPATRMVPLWRLKPLISEDRLPQIGWLDAGGRAAALETEAEPIFLGLDDQGIAHYAVDVSAAAEDAPAFAALGTFCDLRAVAGGLTGGAPSIIAEARSLIAWHGRTAFCGHCGGPTEMADAGHLRQCRDGACGAQYFPRVDPVVIMLVARGNRCLLGRSAHFPGHFYSTLAGFIEPGESIEEAVRREVHEEAGITVGAVRYHSSQPWPFPASLMIGCLAEARSDAITIDRTELEDVRWVSRDDLVAALEDRPGVGFSVPPAIAIARQLMVAWAEAACAEADV